MSSLQSNTHNEDRSRETSLFGMWIFIAMETLFFGGALFLYWTMRHAYPEVFALASLRLESTLAGWNTAVLLTSSLTMALSIYQLKSAHLKQSATFLALTALLGSLFLAIKGYEYLIDARHGLLVGFSYAPVPPLPPQASLFFSVYLLLTGLHALHLTIGVGWCLTMMIRIYRASRAYSVMRPNPMLSPTEVLGLYWHFVDIVWILLLLLLYLIGVKA